MRTAHIKDFKMGWFIGNFKPTLLSTCRFEVAHHFYTKGFKGVPHIHKVATEYNYIIRGKLIASGQEFGAGDFFIYEPHEVSEVEFLEDTDIVIVKTPSMPGDKYDVEVK